MLLQILVPVAVFTAIVLLLSSFVLAARRRLAPTHVVSININDQRELRVEAGDQLLWCLAENDIFLPAACGGRGSCGQCRVTVRFGGGMPLPTEAAHISEREAEQGIRLACMIKVRESISVLIPQSILEIRSWTCTVLSNHNVSTYLKELVLKLPDGERIRFTAGDYVLLEAPPHRIQFRDLAIDAAYRQDWRDNRLYQLKSVAREKTVRAYSLANPPQQDDRVVLVVRIATPPPTAPAAPPGRASSYIFSLEPGDLVEISGPFGEFHVSESHREIVFIAGGAGIAPIRSMVFDQLARGTNRRMSFWYGSRDLHDLCYEDEFERAAEQYDNFEFHVALSSPREDEDWQGHTGFIHRVVYECYLKQHPAPADLEYYLCGPPLMSSAVVQMLEELGVDRKNIFFDDFGT